MATPNMNPLHVTDYTAAHLREELVRLIPTADRAGLMRTLDRMDLERLTKLRDRVYAALDERLTPNDKLTHGATP